MALWSAFGALLEFSLVLNHLRQQPGRDAASARALIALKLGSGWSLRRILAVNRHHLRIRTTYAYLWAGGTRLTLLDGTDIDVRDALNAWLRYRGQTPGPLLCTKSGAPLTIPAAHYLIRRAVRATYSEEAARSSLTALQAAAIALALRHGLSYRQILRRLRLGYRRDGVIVRRVHMARVMRTLRDRSCWLSRFRDARGGAS